MISVLLLATTLAVPVHAGPAVPASAPAVRAPVTVATSAALPQAADSSRTLRDARRAQEDFERFRETRIPAQVQRPDERGQGGRCDEPMGRLCLSYGVDGAPPSPIGATPRPIQDARRELLDKLAEAGAALPGDDWIVGQRVRYLVEAGDLLGAGAVAESCAGTPWWCSALDGLVYHEDDRWIEAGEAFLDALEAMPDRERERWQGESYLLERDGRRFLDVSDRGERDRRRALLWRLADPLYIIPGNDRWTAHMARLTQVRTMEDAWNPFGLAWDIDLEEVTLRYGWALGWERVRGQQSFQRLTQNAMVARLDPDRRRYLPTGPELLEFPATEDDALRVIDGRREPSGYSPTYAPVVDNLSSQTARFRRGSDMLVVHAFARVGMPGATMASASPSDAVDNANGDLPRDLATALFLLPVEGPIIEDGPQPARQGNELEGVWTVEVPNDTDRILSMEGYSRLERRAWRTRRGLERLPDPAGSVAVSDPIFLDAASLDLPETLDAALADVLPTVRFEAGRLVRIGWEVYGIPEGSSAAVALGIERAEQSLARRIGEFFRVLEPPQPVTIRWDDAPPESPGVVFRAVDLQLPALDAGRYDLFLEIRVDDAEPAVTRRRFVIEESGR
ncbi:MAG: hypothetical protein EA350_10640 [Gemmatimonadales bacterium]|nr:MAG: hypothetical protein EA350_10640 [Gemmatimonadales bacterium]